MGRGGQMAVYVPGRGASLSSDWWPLRGVPEVAENWWPDRQTVPRLQAVAFPLHGATTRRPICSWSLVFMEVTDMHHAFHHRNHFKWAAQWHRFQYSSRTVFHCANPWLRVAPVTSRWAGGLLAPSGGCGRRRREHSRAMLTDTCSLFLGAETQERGCEEMRG